MSTFDPDRAQDSLADLEAPMSRADEAAAAWLVRLSSGSATPAERAEFARWRAADPANEAALSVMRALWSGLSLPPAPPAAAAPVAARVAPRRRLRRWALAASVLLGLGLAYAVAGDWRYDEVTGAGERRALTLADGSRLTLGGDAALDVDLDGAARRVALARGEVYFDVQPDAARPFVVDLAFGDVRVLGTRFSVWRDGGEAEVVVAEGRVEVRSGTARQVLTAGQRLSLDPQRLSAVSAVDAEQALAWREGRLVLEGVTLDEAARRLNRHGAGTILVFVDAARQRPFNAVVDLERVDEWLDGVEQQGWARVTRLGPVTLIR